MIYSIPKDRYPIPAHIIEELIYKDENDFEWKIARMEKDIIVLYCGIDYFKESTFECHLSSGRIVSVKNHGCILFNATDFDTFYHVREVIKCGFTDDIWETFEELFTERFEHDMGMLSSELAD